MIVLELQANSGGLFVLHNQRTLGTSGGLFSLAPGDYNDRLGKSIVTKKHKIFSRATRY